MSDQGPSREGFGSSSSPIEHMLRDIREALQMDVAFVSQFSEDQLVFREIEGDAESFGWQEGESFPIDESYCKRVLDGRIPQVVPDAKGEDATKDLRVTSEADIGSYCAVPLVLSDGRLDRKSTRLNSSHANISYAVFCLKKKKNNSTTLL